MIVVTSAAGRALDYGVRCVESVRSEIRASADWLDVRHWYSTTDADTAALVSVGVHAEPSGLARLVEHWREQCAPADIVIWLDGDDELTSGALQPVCHLYARRDVWASYGSFVRDDGVRDYSWNPCFGRRYERAPRFERWRASHLRSFRAGLVQQIPLREFRNLDGAWFESAIDLAVMIPLLELAGDHYVASTDVNCVYNFANSAEKGPDAARVRQIRTREVDTLSRRTPLEPLRERPW